VAALGFLLRRIVIKLAIVKRISLLTVCLSASITVSAQVWNIWVNEYEPNAGERALLAPSKQSTATVSRATSIRDWVGPSCYSSTAALSQASTAKRSVCLTLIWRKLKIYPKPKWKRRASNP
jgi:hypothetical protein